MSITDELREWAKEHLSRSSILAIADRIDAEHERLCSRSRSNGYGDGFTDGFNDVESWVIDHEDEMSEHGWVKLPVDADGEVIHIGDEMDTEHFGTVKVEGFVHRAVAFYNYGKQPAYLCTTPANLCRHHHAPTVEDVLLEMLYKAHIYDEREMELLPDLIADYAAKLQLADDWKEQ